MANQLDLASIFSEQELTLLLEGLYAIQEQRKHVLDLANTHLLAMSKAELEPDDLALPLLEQLIERFALASPQGPMLVEVRPKPEGESK